MAGPRATDPRATTQRFLDGRRGITSQADLEETRRALQRVAAVGDKVQNADNLKHFMAGLETQSDDPAAFVIRDSDGTKVFQINPSTVGLGTVGEPDPRSINILNAASLVMWLDEFITSILVVNGATGDIIVPGKLEVGELTDSNDVPIDGHVRDRYEVGARHDPGATTITPKGMTAWTVPATATSADTSNGSWLNFATSTVLNNASGPNGPMVTRLDWGFDVSFRLNIIDVASVRLAVGLYSGDPSAAANPAVHGAGFRFDTGAGDASWRAWTSDSATPGGTPTGNVPVLGPVTFRLVGTTTEIKFYINNSLVITRTANLPGATTLLAPYVRITNLLAGTARNIRFGFFNSLSR